MSASRAFELLPASLGMRWESRYQVDFRRNWLLSMGLTEREKGGDRLTELGRGVLAARDVTVPILPPEPIEEQALVEEEDEGEAVLNEQPLTLTPAQVPPHLGDLLLPATLLERCCAALTAGRHLLLVGPPGTGKTELATVLAEAAKNEGFCEGLLTATASADWTTFDTIGGYALEQGGQLRFRPGVYPRALKERKWLLIDELNRADVDKAFGELMTVLSGKPVTTPYMEGDQAVSIGPDADGAYRQPQAFRLISTMNSWDRTSLFRLSAALQRRFAVIYVGPPDERDLETLLRGAAARRGGLPAQVVETPRLALRRPGASALSRAGPRRGAAHDRLHSLP
ncbi:MAG: AAA family ATPase [Deltaproteobacteria bacterium]|nr:AAA family ATPase [Deltaproteobacteria bacterium]